ncbi:FAD-dependent oxidoreductase [Microtetraspora sp. NBRC 13810]|uniref:FAD-dependent oxidoreductase n=1 Tax=Microtetraspora sp. NBRC 13810 TaxID=3030990 RepID=UPI0024A55D07|nr:FAD-dependent monooxygenase [Microtetraspora sp. NBRC 13810]GLW09648.1 FAD-dependent oxidoreductase [Microtetraspora sp. NBRC 13810]
MTAIRKALVIGGGVAGPAAAMALQKAGIESVVYEAYPNPADDVGVFLTVATNGIDALRTIGSDEGVVAAGFPTPKITLRNSGGKNLGGTNTGAALPDGTTSQTVRRSDLYRIIQDEAISRGIQIERGKRLVDAKETADGVRAVFADGTEATGDVLIGADGIDSTVRNLIDPSAPPPKYTGLINLGGYTSGVPVDTESCSYSMMFGKRAFFGYAVLPSREVWWYASLPRPVEPKKGELEAIDGLEWQRRLVGFFQHDTGPAVQLIKATRDPEALRATPTRSVPNLRTWHSNRMVIIGDAAHAPTPTSGQGASLSIEDGVVLAKCLRDLADPRQAFGTFEKLRRPRVEAIIKVANSINNNKAPGPIGSAIRDAFTPIIMKLTANSSFMMRQYDYHIDWEEAVRA